MTLISCALGCSADEAELDRYGRPRQKGSSDHCWTASAALFPVSREEDSRGTIRRVRFTRDHTESRIQFSHAVWLRCAIPRGRMLKIGQKSFRSQRSRKDLAPGVRR